MATGLAHKPQTTLPGVTGEKELNDAALERQLLERDRHHRQLAEYRKTFRDIDETVKGRIRELRIRGSVRCGGFIITVKEVPGRSVEFDTKASKQIYIKAVKEE